MELLMEFEYRANMFGIAITQEDLRVLGGEYVYVWVCVFSLVSQLSISHNEGRKASIRLM
jgi:hypothetical protein